MFHYLTELNDNNQKNQLVQLVAEHEYQMKLGNKAPLYLEALILKIISLMADFEIEDQLNQKLNDGLKIEKKKIRIKKIKVV